MIISINVPSVTIAKVVRLALLSLSLFYLMACSDPSETHTDNRVNLNFGFYAFFAPVSYSADKDSVSSGFNTHLGYEADLLTALESMEENKLSFTRYPIAVWDNIWLKSASTKYDIVGGGITILDSRTKDAMNKKKVKFTSGHIAFRQSLLVRAEDKKRIASYSDLNIDVRVGLQIGTTGESRLLQLAGFADVDGILVAGIRIDTQQGVLVSDGSADYFITASASSPNLSNRQRLHPPSKTMPQVIYLGRETELFEALADSRIDAIARGEVGNLDYAHDSGGTFVVTAVDSKVELGGFTLAVEDTELYSWIDKRINWLTDNQKIGYKEWLKDPLIFMYRAKKWKINIEE